VYEAYLELKDVLVESDPSVAGLKAQKMKSALENVDRQYLTGKAASVWNQHLLSLGKELDQIADTKSLAKQRDIFLAFSEEVILLVRGFRLPYAMKTYIQFCPMADGYKGGYWLSRETEIFNPYFGDKMLHCGEVTDTLRF
jgi:Cu(I)/Ag(I) efflux system membrane fusion protein